MMEQSTKYSQRPVLYIEDMAGFQDAVYTLQKTFGCDIVIGTVNEFMSGQTMLAEVIGLVKGPRTKLSQEILDKLACTMHNPIISYVGRNPEKVLEADIKYTSKEIEGNKILIISTASRDITFVAMNKSPLSGAVAGYVAGVTDAFIHENLQAIHHLTIGAGNDFSKRGGHAFKEGSAETCPKLSDVSMGVIGAGDVGKCVIDLFQNAGAQIAYSATDVHHTMHYDFLFVPNANSLLKRPSWANRKYYVVSLHLPPSVHLSLKQADNIDLFFNTSSGKNIDEKELIEAVEEGRIRHAVIDVFNHENVGFEDNRLSRYVNDPRFTITPHIAYKEQKAIQKTLELSVDPILKFKMLE